MRGKRLRTELRCIPSHEQGTSLSDFELLLSERKLLMSFADIVEEVRHLPLDEQLELQEILERNLISLRREEIYRNHLETLKELKEEKLQFTSDIDELIKQVSEE